MKCPTAVALKTLQSGFRPASISLRRPGDGDADEPVHRGRRLDEAVGQGRRQQDAACRDRWYGVPCRLAADIALETLVDGDDVIRRPGDHLRDVGDTALFAEAFRDVDLSDPLDDLSVDRAARASFKAFRSTSEIDARPLRLRDARNNLVDDGERLLCGAGQRLAALLDAENVGDQAQRRWRVFEAPSISR